MVAMVRWFVFSVLLAVIISPVSGWMQTQTISPEEANPSRVLFASADGSRLSGALYDPTGTWQTVNTNPGRRISMLSPADGWILRFSGTSTTASLYHWDGEDWSAAGTLAHSQNIVHGDILAVSPTDIWVVLAGGPAINNPPRTTMYHKGVGDWQVWATYGTGVAPGVAMSSLSMVTANDIWAAAPNMFGTQFYHWNGSAWSTQALYGLCCDISVGTDLDMVSATDGWSVGIGADSDIARWNGSMWDEFAYNQSTVLRGIDMLSSTDGWIVGNQGLILHWNGSSWNSVASPVTSGLNAVDMITPSDGWAVGDGGVVLHYDGSSWTQTVSPTTGNLYAVSMVWANDGWSAGDTGTLRYIVPPQLEINFADGRPGSFFRITGNLFPPSSPLELSVNRVLLSDDLTTDADGAFSTTLTTVNANNGLYRVVASVNPSASIVFRLEASKPLRADTGSGPYIAVPTGIALDENLFLPLLRRFH